MNAVLQSARGVGSRALSDLYAHRWGLAVSALACCIRFVRRAPEFTSSDAADLPFAVWRLACSTPGISKLVDGLALFRLGGVQPFIVYLHAVASRAFGVNLNAQAWENSTVLVSGIGVFFAYLLGREIVGQKAGLGAALLVAVSPIHVMTGRHLAAPWAYEIAFQLALLWMVVRLCREPKASRRAAFYWALAIYMWCGNQMMAIIPVIGFAVLTAARIERKSGERLASFIRVRFASFHAVALLASVGVLLYATFVQRDGHLAHALFERTKVPGWYFDNWYSDLIRGLGYGPAWVGLASTIASLFASKRIFSWERLPLVYCLCYTLPFWFLIGPETTMTKGYVVYGLTGFLLVAATVPFQLRLPERVSVAITLATGAMLLIATGANAHLLYRARFLGGGRVHGSYSPSLGIEAAAAYIRRDAGGPKGTVFSDASGGGGLEPPIVKLYFRRKAFVLFDSSRTKPYEKFRKNAKEIHYLLVKPGNERLASRYFPEFFKRATVMDDSGKTRPLLLVYSRADGPRVTLQASDGPVAYELAYPGLCSK